VNFGDLKFTRFRGINRQRTETNAMRLIGMLDSPYVRRVAISFAFMDIRFSHESLSVFRNFDAFAQINPVVKAPTLVTDDGLTLMDSTLILEHAQHLAPERSLMPRDPREHGRALRTIGLALAACEKTVQIIYEQNLRPPEKQHQPWIDRVREQLLAAYGLLETGLGSGREWLFGPAPLQPDITLAVAWRFTREVLPDVVHADRYTALSVFSARAETLPEFRAWPFDG
jgi:glutathione S-transferase